MDIIVQKVSVYVQNLFDEYFKPELTYHNLAHTQKVVRRANEIAQYYELSADDSRVVLVAAWFHDVGYLTSGIHEHETNSVAFMKLFLTPLG